MATYQLATNAQIQERVRERMAILKCAREREQRVNPVYITGPLLIIPSVPSIIGWATVL